MMHRKWITAVELDRWAATNAAKTVLPELLRRLVHATIERQDLERVNFPGGDEVHRPGYDGETKTKRGNAWVPEGVAYWELSATDGVKTKLEGDYSKRVAERGPGDFSGVSYIAVTARDYQNGRAWAEEKKALGEWRDVRVYDSNMLEQWLETAPAVALWLARTMGKRIDGVSDVLGHWENVQGVLKKPLPPSIPLISRDQTAARFEEWMSSSAGLLDIAAESPREVLDVFCAWALSSPDERQQGVLGRAVIVGDIGSWRELSASAEPLILVASDQLEVPAELAAEAVRSGHHVLLSAPVGRTTAHRLPRIRRSKLKEGLLGAGLKDAEAGVLADHSGGSFTILKRRFQRPIAGGAPKWAEAGAAAELAPLLLVGAWRDDSPADQAIVSKVLGQPYDKALEIVNRWKGEPDSPVRWSNGVWEFVSPLDAWTFLAPKLTRKELEAFEEAAVAVLGTDNPMYDLAADERWCAQIHGKVLPHSGIIREGLARSLALVATQSDASPVTDTIALQDRVDRAVKRILAAKAPWQRWASLGSLLSTLAEAAPSVLLDAMEADLRQADPALVKLFGEEGGDVVTGRAEHVGILWALETVAWSQDFLPRAALILARLAEKDPGGRIGNRPAASLEDTFCTWHPHTMASAQQRLEVIETVLKRHPAVGWKLLLDLFPESHSAISLRRTPEWRFWAEDWAPGVKRTERRNAVKGAIALARGMAEKAPEKWPEIIPRLANFPKEEFEAVVSAIDRIDLGAIDTGVRFKIWEALGALIANHRSFSEAAWALPDAALVPLERLRDKLRPADPCSLAVPVFSHRFEMSGDHKLSWDERQKRQREARRRAVKDVYDAQGLEGILALSRRVDDARPVGMAFADVMGAEADGAVLPALLLCGEKPVETMGDGYAAMRAHAGGSDWAKTLPLASWKPAEAGLLLARLPFAPATWDFVKTFGEAIDSAYWEKAPSYFSHGLDARAVELAARRLLEVGRPLATLQMLEDHLEDDGCPPSNTLIELTTSAMTSAKHEDYKLDGHVLESIMAKLQKCPDADQGRLAALEWLVLPALRWRHDYALTLHKELARNPDLFIDMLTTLYRPASRDKSADAPADEGKQLQAKRAQQLLHDWKTVPGTREDGSVDAAVLKDWVRRAREKAASLDRAHACDVVLGETLAYAPADADGLWPCEAVRDLIEDLASPEMEHGLDIGIANKRGAFWRGEGGNQERELAQKYYGHSRACVTRWPRTAAVLKGVADDYERDARRQDAEAEARA